MVPGIDGQKMSKSYNNTIDLFGDEKEVKKRIMGIKTDTTPVEAPKPVEDTPLYELLKVMAPPSEFPAVDASLEAGGKGLRRVQEDACSSLPRDVRRGPQAPAPGAARRTRPVDARPPRRRGAGPGDRAPVLAVTKAVGLRRGSGAGSSRADGTCRPHAALTPQRTSW